MGEEGSQSLGETRRQCEQKAEPDKRKEENLGEGRGGLRQKQIRGLKNK